jgi:hypothetical protein
MITAHVCSGQSVLQADSWREIFTAWVSYDKSIDTLMFSDRAERLWGDIARGLVEAALQSRTAESLADRIRSTYLLKIADLRDFGYPEDVVHIIHFQNAMESVVFKKGSQ